MIRAVIALCCLAAILDPGTAGATKIKIGYWTSGFSIGFGAVLEAEKFMEKEGLEPEYVHFADVNGPSKAILTQSIDVAFAAPTTGAFNLAADGVPIEIVLGTQIAEGTFVVKEGSPIRTLAELKGKKIGMSPTGSATYAIATALLERNYGLKIDDYTPVPGNESRLAQFLAGGDIDAAALRAVTIAAISQTKLRPLGNFIAEWQRMTNSTAVPILGTAIVHKAYAAQNPDAVVKFVMAMIKTSRFGGEQTSRVAAILAKSGNLAPKDAEAYARLWKKIYFASMEPADVATYRAMLAIFRAAGSVEKPVPEDVYATTFYEQAKKRL